MAVQTLNSASFDSTSTFHHECHRLLAIIYRIFDMECHSSSIAILNILKLMFSAVLLNMSTMFSFALHPCTYYASILRKFYLVALWPHLMQPFKANLHWKMKDMRVEMKISTYPLLSDELPESTMFSVMTASPLIPQLHTAQLPASHITSLYDAGYHSVPLMIKKILQLTFHLLTAMHHHRTPWVLHSSHLPSLSFHVWWLKSRWRGRGFPNSNTRWWPLDHRRNPRQTSVYTWTFSATFTVFVPMSIYGLYFYIVPQHIGSQWHFWIWRLDDHIEGWRYSCSRWQDWILKHIDYG